MGSAAFGSPFFGPSTCCKFLVPAVSMAYSQLATRVFEEWRNDDTLVTRAAGAILAMVGRKGALTRQEVAENHTLLAPVIRHLGFSVNLTYDFNFCPWLKLGYQLGVIFFIHSHVIYPGFISYLCP